MILTREHIFDGLGDLGHIRLETHNVRNDFPEIYITVTLSKQWKERVKLDPFPEHPVEYISAVRFMITGNNPVARALLKK